MKTTYSLSLRDDQIAFLDKLYADEKRTTGLPYVKFRVDADGCTITVYDSKKVVFAGKNAEEHAALFMTDEIAEDKPIEKTKAKSLKQTDSVFPQAGSDEVGTGDYFGPVVVCACRVKADDYVALKDLNITDSKAMNDVQVRKVAPMIMERVDFSVLVVQNSKYNEVHKTHNMNAIKAILHNAAYIHLKKKIKSLPKLTVVDQFAHEALYYRYLVGEKEIVKGLTFETKAESKYFAVACASVIARYAFLQTFDAMKTQYGMEFPKGASSIVDEAAQRFIAMHGRERLGEVVKLHFKNSNNL
ncbi:MAG: ribonuclease HIII [Erysipelotrichaceae bacterium]